ncbi:MAG: glycoside hydrolase family 28 protein [Halobacteriaceae archaeon]
MTDHSRLSVTDYGAEGDGETATDAFQDALDACAAAGGGTVVVPAGDYVVGTIVLGDDTTLHLAAGATVRASQDEDDYYAAGSTEPGPDGELPFLVAQGVENVALTGRGTFFGHGTDLMRMDDPIEGHSGQESAWPLVSEGKPEARQGDDYLDRSGDTSDWPVAKPEFRPGSMFHFEDCENVLVRDLTFEDMPSWTLHFDDCDEVDVLGVDVLNNMLIPNCDGIAVVSSRNVHIADCTVVACDDTIVPGSHEGSPVENLTVTNCTLASHACAIKFGSGTAGDIRNCTFSNITIYGSNRGLGIQHRDGGDLENILFQDITIETTLPRGPWWGKAEPIYVTSVPRHEDTDLGAVRNVRFRNVVADAENGAVIYAHDDADVEGVVLDGVDLTMRDPDAAEEVGGNLDLQPTSAMPPILEHDVPAVFARGVSDLTVADLNVEWDDDVPEFCTSAVACEDVTDVTIDGVVGAPAHGGAFLELCDTKGITVRDSRLDGDATAFLDVSDTEEERIFALNDAAAASIAVRGEADFAESGNRT